MQTCMVSTSDPISIHHFQHSSARRRWVIPLTNSARNYCRHTRIYNVNRFNEFDLQIGETSLFPSYLHNVSSMNVNRHNSCASRMQTYRKLTDWPRASLKDSLAVSWREAVPTRHIVLYFAASSDFVSATMGKRAIQLYTHRRAAWLRDKARPSFPSILLINSWTSLDTSQCFSADGDRAEPRGRNLQRRTTYSEIRTRDEEPSGILISARRTEGFLFSLHF